MNQQCVQLVFHLIPPGHGFARVLMLSACALAKAPGQVSLLKSTLHLHVAEVFYDIFQVRFLSWTMVPHEHPS